MDDYDNLQFYVKDNGLEPLPDETTQIEKIWDEEAEAWKVKIPMSHVIEKANLYTSEDNEFVVDRKNMEQIELHAGSQNIYGNLGGDFIAQGYKVFNEPGILASNVTVKDINNLINRIKPEDIYNDTFDSNNFHFYNISSNNIIFLMQGYRMRVIGIKEDGTLSLDSGYGSEFPLSCPISKQPKYIGIILIYESINGNEVSVRRVPVVLNENGNPISLSINNCPYYFVIEEDGSWSQVKLTLSSAEKDYFLGLTEIRTHISSNAYAKIAEGATTGYYNSSDSTFYTTYINSTYSNPITPKNDAYYVDIPTNTIYKYDGTAYVVDS